MIKNGPMMFAQVTAYPVTMLFVGWVLIPRIMCQQATTGYELLENRLGLVGRFMGAAMFMALRTVWMAAILYTTSDQVFVPPAKCANCFRRASCWTIGRLFRFSFSPLSPATPSIESFCRSVHWLASKQIDDIQNRFRLSERREFVAKLKSALPSVVTVGRHLSHFVNTLTLYIDNPVLLDARFCVQIGFGRPIGLQTGIRHFDRQQSVLASWVTVRPIPSCWTTSQLDSWSRDGR